MPSGGLSWWTYAMWPLFGIVSRWARTWYIPEQGLPSHEDVICSARFCATEWRPFGSMFALMTWNVLC